MKEKLIYILPEANTKTHMKYNVEFLKDLGKEVNIFLIIEKENADKFENDWGMKAREYFGENISVNFVEEKNVFYRSFKTLRLLAFAKKLGYKKVYIHYSFIGIILTRIISKNFEIFYWNCGLPWNYTRPSFQEFYESFAYKLISHLVTGGEDLGKKYAQHYGFKSDNNITMPNWINVEEFRNEVFSSDSIKKELNISTEKQIIFFNQRLAKRKGVLYIPEILKKTVENVHLILTSDGPNKQDLFDILDKENLTNRVHYLGRVDHKKIAQILKETDVYILPSEEEGFSHSLLESFTGGVPAVSFDVGATKEMYSKGFEEYCVHAKDIESFTEKLNLLLTNKNLHHNFKNSLTEKVFEYDKVAILKMFKDKILK